jgi:hypothetical protein
VTSSYIELPVELNGAALKATIYEAMELAFPGWEPNPNNPEKWLIDSQVDRLVVPLSQLAADVAAELFHSYGEKIVGVQPIAAQSATVLSTWTMKDAAGYTIKAGTQVNVATSGDEGQGFRVVNTVNVPPASTETVAGEVLLEAIEPGKGANELSGDAKPEDTLNFLAAEGGITLVGESSGGEEAEDPATYLNRLTETMQTLAPRPILPRDVEILARNVPGVFRAVALDLFDPENDDPEDPETWLSERHVSVVVCDAAGLPCSAPVKAAVKAELESKREANFKFFVLDPDYTEIAIHYEVVPRPGFDQAAVDATVDAALSSALAPNQFGVDSATDPRSWNNQRVVRYQDLVTIVNNQQGVDHYTVLKVKKEGGGAFGVVDVALAGAAPLTKPGKIEVGA